MPIYTILFKERNENDLLLELTDSDGVTAIVEVTLFEDGNFHARVGAHHVSEEMRNDINHYLAENEVQYS